MGGDQFMKKHNVTTSIDIELYNIAKKRKMSIREIVESGIKQRLTLRDQKSLLLKELELHNQAVDSIMKRLNDIEMMEESVEEFNFEKVLGIVENLMDKGRSVKYSSIEYWSAELDLLPEQLQKMILDEYPDVKIDSPSRDETVIDGLIGD